MDNRFKRTTRFHKTMEIKLQNSVHVVCEVVILIAIVLWVSSKNKQLLFQIQQLLQRVEEQEEKLALLEQRLDRMSMPPPVVLRTPAKSFPSPPLTRVSPLAADTATLQFVDVPLENLDDELKSELEELQSQEDEHHNVSPASLERNLSE